MLFLGLGTGLGSALSARVSCSRWSLAICPTQEDLRGLRQHRRAERKGKKRWRQEVVDVVAALTAALEPEYVVLGGGNAKELKELPPGCRLGGPTQMPSRAGFRVWAADAPARILG